MNNYIYYINGQFVKSIDAKISFSDGAFQRGNAIFETIRFNKDCLFNIDNHIKRLNNGLKYLEFNIKETDASLINLIKKVIAKNELAYGAINIIISKDFDINNPFATNTNLYISIRPIKDLEHGPVKVIFLNEWEFPIIRFKSPIKTNNYVGNIKALMVAKKNNVFDAVFINKKNQITESTMRNIFFIKDNVLITPCISLGILPGTTRQLVINLAHELGYDCKEKIIKFDDIQNMDEAFLTSSSYGVISCFWSGWNSNFKLTNKIRESLKQKLFKGF
ncbi:MAG: hypothetical protein CMG00_07260 [Candidatus Marinimicrobia bacterium]|nr:hypothetical protein [Candidatus Neomarinimicrobiota bacterium]|tara:strand:- start:12573 stop:13403 length:831 start_codon:yes stop_codon:yes gene_type:complete